MASSCAVVGCPNSYKILSKWRKTECDIHKGQLHCDCPCCVPFKLHSFPKCPTKRLEWIKELQRKDFKPGKRSAVCSVHFLENRPTGTNPLPTLHMGYDKKVKVGRRMLVKYQIPPKKRRVSSSSTQADGNLINGAADFIEIPLSPSCILNEENSSGTPQINENSHVGCVESSRATCNAFEIDAATQWQDVPVAPSNISEAFSIDFATQCEDYAPLDYFKKLSQRVSIGVQVRMPQYTAMVTDTVCIFHTGLPLSVFFGIVPFMKNFQCLSKKMCVEDQLMLVLMRLRLALRFEDLAERFGVSKAWASELFKKWIRIFAKHLTFVRWLPKETIQAGMPTSFKRSYPNTTCVIDCAEIFIERPSNPTARSQTYSHYKSHNTVKFLIAIAPNGFIMFVSSSYGGTESDKFIVHDSGFLNNIRPGDEVMGDRGFAIENELLARNASLNIPAPLYRRNEFSECDFATRRIASVRIHVERATARFKRFRIFKATFPMSHRRMLDDIVLTTCALCNLQTDSIKDQ